MTDMVTCIVTSALDILNCTKMSENNVHDCFIISALDTINCTKMSENNVHDFVFLLYLH